MGGSRDSEVVRKRFALQLARIREEQDGDLDQWATAANVLSSQLSALEAGKLDIPARETLIDMTKRLGLTPREHFQLMVSAGYLPELPLGFGSSPVDRILLVRMLMEVWDIGDRKYRVKRKPREGFTEMFQERMEGLHKNR